MASERVWIVHEVNGTTVSDEYTCEHVAVTMGPHGTVCDFTNGADAKGRKVKAALYATAHSVVRYIEEQ